MKKNFIDRYYEENQKYFWTLNRKIGIGVLAFLLVAFTFTGCSNNIADTDEIVNVEIQDELDKESIKVGNDGVNAAIAPDGPGQIVVEDDEPTAGKMVAMSVEDLGRSDPFLPLGQQQVGATSVSRIPRNYDLLPPPEMISVDSTATDVMTTKVSGIMYDKSNPSAIVNIADSDYLVRSGDVINGYKILSIGKETVTVQYGANVYKAGVGEMFADNGINYNTISNLENKFGGRNNSANKY